MGVSAQSRFQRTNQVFPLRPRLLSHPVSSLAFVPDGKLFDLVGGVITTVVHSSTLVTSVDVSVHPTVRLMLVTGTKEKLTVCSEIASCGQQPVHVDYSLYR